MWWRRCEKLVGTKIEVEIFLKNTSEKWWKICPKIRKLVLFFTASFVRIFVGVQTKRHTYIPLSSCPFQYWPMTTSQKSLEHLQSQTFLSFCMRRDRKKRNYAKYANVFKWKSNTRWDFWQILGAGERCVKCPLGEDYEWTFCTFSTFFHLKPNAHKIQLMVIFFSRWTSFSHLGSFLRSKTYLNISNPKHLIISDKNKNLHSKIFTIVHMRTLDDISWYWWLCRSQLFCPVFLVTLPNLYLYA